jgi:XapX domain-containing protein
MRKKPMKPYLLSLGAGILVGIVYALLGVRSPAPPTVALLGLLGILLGEQVVPIAKRIAQGKPVMAYVKTECARDVLGPQAVKTIAPETSV